jgi:outer membrane murein-binding lipoprotein Lpp
MNIDEKVLKILEDLQAGQKALQDDMTAVRGDVSALQDDVSAIKTETAKIPAMEQQLDHHGKLLTGLTATMATVVEEQQTQRMDIRSLHTEVHETREEVTGEVRAAREEAKRDTMDLKAAVVKRFQSDERRITNIEEHEGIENPEKH